MLFVWLAWALAGAVIGLLASAARVGPSTAAAPQWLALLGAGSALVGGGLGTLVWGSVFATSAALWVAVLGVTLLPRLRAWSVKRRALLAQRRPDAANTPPSDGT
jgi:hypothetical protein